MEKQSDHKNDFIDKLARALLANLGVDGVQKEDENLSDVLKQIKNNKSI